MQCSNTRSCTKKAQYDYSLVKIENTFDFTQNQQTFKDFKDTKVTVINQKNNYFIICFKKTVVLIQQTSINILHQLFSYNPILENNINGLVSTIRKSGCNIIDQIKKPESILKCISMYLILKSYENTKKKKS